MTTGLWKRTKRHRKVCSKTQTKNWANPKYRKMMYNAQKNGKGWQCGEDNPHWKGGKPKCIDCNNRIPNNKAKRCMNCHRKHIRNNAHGYIINNFCIICNVRLASMYAKKCVKCHLETYVSPTKGKKRQKPIWNKGKSKYKNGEEKKKAIREGSRLRYYTLSHQQHFALMIRTRIRNAFKSNSKKSSTEKLLGCTMQFFRDYIQNKFIEGMSWNNYGNRENQWSLDHIIHISKFDLTRTKEQKKAFHFTNCQPLWAIDNIKKGNK